MKLSIDNDDLDLYDLNDLCDKYGYLMDQQVSMVFNSLPELEHSLCDEINMVLICIAVYVCRKDDRGDGSSDTKFHVNKFGEILKN